MDIRIIEQIQKHRPKLLMKTIQRYGMLLKRLNNDKIIMSTVFLNKPQKIAKFMQFQRYKDSTKHAMYVAINVLLTSYQHKKEDLIKDYKFEMNKLSRAENCEKVKLGDETKRNIITVEQIDNLITKYESVLLDLEISKLEEIDSYSYRVLRKYVILSLIRVNPRMGNKYTDLDILNKSDDKNYIYKRSDNYYIVINTLKTKKYDGAIKFKLTTKLSRYIDYLIKHSNNNQYLLCQKDRKTKMTGNGYINQLLKMFYQEYNIKRVSINVLKYVLCNQNNENKIED